MKKKSASQSVLICLFVVSTFTVCNSPARADTTTWTRTPGTPGDWFTDANWYNHVPTSSTDAYINNGGTAQINHLFNNGGATAQSVTLGQYAGDSGTVLVDSDYGALLLPSNDCTNENPTLGAIYVGYRGGGKLSITNGGSVTNGLSYIAALTTGP